MRSSIDLTLQHTFVLFLLFVFRPFPAVLRSDWLYAQKLPQTGSRDHMRDPGLNRCYHSLWSPEYLIIRLSLSQINHPPFGFNIENLQASFSFIYLTGTFDMRHSLMTSDQSLFLLEITWTLEHYSSVQENVSIWGKPRDKSLTRKCNSNLSLEVGIGVYSLVQSN